MKHLWRFLKHDDVAIPIVFFLALVTIPIWIFPGILLMIVIECGRAIKAISRAVKAVWEQTK